MIFGHPITGPEVALLDLLDAVIDPVGYARRNDNRDALQVAKDIMEEFELEEL